MAQLHFNWNRPTRFVSGFLFFAAGLWAQPVRITQPIDRSATVQLPGNVSPRAQVQYDQGPVEPSFPMQYVTLLLRPSTDQKASLSQLLADQQDRSSPKYHHWLTPELYADSFGLNPADMAKIASWLQAEGFTVNYQARGRNWIAISGDAAQIQHTFHTEIHQYAINGEKHFANATNPSIPAAIAGIVTGIHGLDDFRPKPAYTRGKSVHRSAMRPDFDSGGSHYLAPDDIATIYDLNTLYSSGIDGTAQTVVVVGQSDFYPTDISDFRSSFNLPYQPIQSPPCATNALCMILAGPDPGITDGLSEAELDLEWAGAVARNAAIYYVNSTNAFTSAQYAIDNDLGPVVSMSFGSCEPQVYTFDFDPERSLAQEANSFGITWVAASGDAGAADCDSGSEAQATKGVAVDFPGSIPEVTAVGGTEFNEGGGTYWNPSNGANGGSALSYIPEMGWNDTVYGTGLQSYTVWAASGGGVSIYYPTPAWQTGPGFPNDGFRNVPDVSMTTSGAHDGYLVCRWDVQGCNYQIDGGTSAATPVFAGILALLNQYLINKGVQSQAGLGNINPTLYALYQSNPGAFHDITTGSNVVPCQIGTPDCTTGSFGYYAQAGYDQVTGLGSVDGYNLAVAWGDAPQTPRLSITKSHSGNFTQGQNGATYSVTVTNAGLGPTTGTVSVTETVPSGLTLVSMSGSGSSGASTWICAGSTCTTSNVLNAGWSYPLTVTVNVGLGAPGQVANQVSVSGGGSATAGASDVTTIQPILGGDVMSKSAPVRECTAPPPASAFLTTDSEAVVWFGINYWNVGDQAALNWYAPNGSLYQNVPWTLSSSPAPPWCFWDTINIAGNPPALEPGNWSVALTWNNSLLFTLPFTIQPGPTYTIVGQVTLSGSPLSEVTVTLSGSQSGTATTNGSGNYSLTAPSGGNYTVTPSLSGYTFNPTSLSFNNLSGNQSGANFAASTVSYTISGQVTLSGNGLSGATVTLSGSQNGTTTTNGSGNYTFTVPAVGKYTVTPSLTGYTFNPPSLSFNSLSGNQTASFTANPVVITYTISGQATASGSPLSGVTVTLNGSRGGTTTTDSSGNYSFTEAAGGSYTVTPSLSGYTFSPTSQTFNSLSGNQAANFISSAVVTTSGLFFVSMPPCRVVDTRDANKPTGFGPPFVSGGKTISYAIPNGPCNGIPSASQAYSLNVTVVPHGELGYLTVWPAGQSQPLASTLNSLDGEVKANAAIVPAGSHGDISVYATNDTDVVLDINGYFVPPNTVPNELAFYPMTPCRLVDTRPGAPSTISTGALTGGVGRTLPILSSSCNVPATAQAYSLNFTLVPPGPVGYLTVYPTGESLPIVSTLNDPTGTVEANAAIAPAGSGGSIGAFVTQTTDLVLDINGYFAPVGAGGLSLYTLPTCRVLDTRNPPGAPPFEGSINVNIGSSCGATGAAQAYVFNATVVPDGMLGYLTLWPQGSVRPVVSTLNAYNGEITSNMAIVPTSNTEISAFADDNTYLILDISGYFAP
jgi:hypothetical protein